MKHVLNERFKNFIFCFRLVCRTHGPVHPGMDCIFPFGLPADDGVAAASHHQCYQSPSDGWHYCAVEVDSSQQMVEGMQGMCNEQCDLPGTPHTVLS